MKFNELKQLLDRTKTELVAVSKKNPASAILDVYHKGQRVFGENHVQELLEKASLLPKDIQWHMIGHLQKNKVRQLLPWVSMIQSVDNVALMKLIHKEAEKIKKVIPVLLEIKIAEEESKYGFTIDEIRELFTHHSPSSFPYLRFCGVMGMATFTDDQDQVRHEFSLLRSYYQELRGHFFSEQDEFLHISMGMSGDYALAIEEGSTMVRIGSLIFGERSY